MNKKIVLISCVKSKMNKPAKAKDLYISPLFKLNFKYAKSLNPSNIFVLSAKYDLVDMNQIISPYEKTLNKMKKIERQQWTECVIQKLKAQYHLGSSQWCRDKQDGFAIVIPLTERCSQPCYLLRWRGWRKKLL